jgi:MFS family permease
MGGYMLGPFFGYFVSAQFNVVFAEIGLLFTMFSAGAIFGGFFGGALADKIGRKFVIIFGLVSSALSSLAMPWLQNIEWFYALAALSGLLGSVGGPARGALLTDILPVEKRTEGFGIFRISFNISAMVGPILGGFIFTAMGTYWPLFVFDAVSSVITAIIVWVKIPETKPEAKSEAEEKSVELLSISTDGAQATEKKGFGHTLKGYLQVFRDKTFIFYVFVVMLMSFVYMQLNSTLGPFLLRVHEFPVNWFGYLISANAAFVIAFQWLITRATRKISPFINVAIGVFLYAVGFGIYGLISPNWNVSTAWTMFFVAMIVITIGECVCAPHMQSMIGLFAPEDKRGRYMAVGSFSWILPNLVGVVGAGAIMDSLDPRALWFYIFLIGSVAVCGFMALYHMTKKRFDDIQKSIDEKKSISDEVSVVEIVEESQEMIQPKQPVKEAAEIKVKS